MKTNNNSILCWTICHFLVDTSCHFIINRLFLQSNIFDIMLITILYNMVAFAFELPIGALSDRMNKTFDFSLLGMGLIFFGSIINIFYKYVFFGIIVFFIALGNAFFHVGGGRFSLIIGDKKATHIGIFSSAGALGVFFGTLLARLNIVLLPIFIMLIGFLYLYFVRKENLLYLHLEKENLLKVCNNINNYKYVIIGTVSYFLISFISIYVQNEYNSVNKDFLLFIFAFSIFISKMCGGIIYDYVEKKKLFIFVIVIFIILFFINKYRYIHYIFISLLINIFVPIITFNINLSLKNRPGLSFGITKFMIFISTLPFMFASISISFK